MILPFTNIETLQMDWLIARTKLGHGGHGIGLIIISVRPLTGG